MIQICAMSPAGAQPIRSCAASTRYTSSLHLGLYTYSFRKYSRNDRVRTLNSMRVKSCDSKPRIEHSPVSAKVHCERDASSKEVVFSDKELVQLRHDVSGLQKNIEDLKSQWGTDVNRDSRSDTIRTLQSIIRQTQQEMQSFAVEQKRVIEKFHTIQKHFQHRFHALNSLASHNAEPRAGFPDAENEATKCWTGTSHSKPHTSELSRGTVKSARRKVSALRVEHGGRELLVTYCLQVRCKAKAEDIENLLKLSGGLSSMCSELVQDPKHTEVQDVWIAKFCSHHDAARALESLDGMSTSTGFDVRLFPYIPPDVKPEEECLQYQ